jgi:eukaryotic-like serine/threonine-protein kinase
MLAMRRSGVKRVRASADRVIGEHPHDDALGALAIIRASHSNNMDHPPSRPRAPWWMYLIATSFIGCYVMQGYVYFRGPETPFTAFTFGDEALVVQGVAPDSAAARAGVQAGDRVISIGEFRIRGLGDWDFVRQTMEIGHPYVIQLERPGASVTTTLTLPGRAWSRLPVAERVSAIENLIDGCIVLLLAGIVAFTRPHDRVARLGAVVLGLIAINGFRVTTGYAAVTRGLPLPVALMVWWPSTAIFLLPPLFFVFCATFPRRLFAGRWAWSLALTPSLFFLLPIAFFFVLTFFGVSFGSAQTGSSDVVPRIGGTILFGYLVAALVALVVNYRRLDLNEKRRVRVLVAGTVVSFALTLPISAFSTMRLQSIPAVFRSSAYDIAATTLFLALPFSWAYAILRHQVFDVRVLLRQGLQYALARRVLLAAVPALVIALVIDLLAHGDQPLLAIVRARGWLYLVLVGLAAAAYTNRQRWLDALDRRFFRERYDAQRLLREVAEEVSAARTFADVAPRVVGRIETALHAEFVALLVREPREPAYSMVAVAPAGHALPGPPAESKLVALVRLLGKPLEVPQTSSGWLSGQLPPGDTDFLRREDIHLIVPVATGADRREALLVLGRRRSEEPYAREDVDLLVAIAVSLALLLDRPTSAATMRVDRFEECPQCGTCYDTGASQCTQDGTGLKPVILPRLLDGRYRIERRLGQGGMGTVYAAVDTELERRVAVKLIREDLVGSADAADRFRREARVAAGFSHPNVVVIHDFGIVAGTRAYLVMELLDGVTVRQWLSRQGRFTGPQTLALLRGLCSALDAAHSRQLIHRDLKPENIFVVRAADREAAKVLDFGIAKFCSGETEALTGDTAPGVLVGTRGYMSPEQLRGGPAHPIWDLWALAATVYEMLAGSHPFEGSSHTFESAAPPGWQPFFERAFASDPQTRPQSAPAFLAAAEDAIVMGGGAE